jgi:hypothetical protein
LNKTFGKLAYMKSDRIKRVQVQTQTGTVLTYETDLKGIRVGTRVILPAPWWLHGVDNQTTMKGKVISLTSDYTGDCLNIISRA